jgi:hypothetical protein
MPVMRSIWRADGSIRLLSPLLMLLCCICVAQADDGTREQRFHELRGSSLGSLSTYSTLDVRYLVLERRRGERRLIPIE